LGAKLQKKDKCPKRNNGISMFFYTFAPQIVNLRKMDHLPQDPFMLVSSINMLLRDNEYDSLEALCDDFGRDINEIKAYLKEYGFDYLEEQKQFR